MYISLNWLKDFVKIPAKIEAADIAKELTRHTVEVEGLIRQAEQFNRVVVGKVLEVKKHPNADRLRLAVVDIKKEKLNIVCGAPNLAEGQLVPVALVGAVLPGGLEIKESEIRGEKSSGMICAEDELGLGKGHDGIIVLKEGTKIGEAFAKYLKADDIILEVDNKSLSNRPDLLNHYGIAREISVIFDLSLKPYDKVVSRKFAFPKDKENKFEVKIEDKEACPRYMAVRIDGIEVAESPAWLKERLIAVNQKPINNIVDLTNYVMLECGQPLHAFNADKVKKISVRRAGKNETFETLDEKERNLNEDDLLITNGQEAIAIAGIMGGKDSGITVETKSIILESANFKAGIIRKTSQRLGLRTEASTRYEKALDPNLTEIALFRFLTLLAEVCPNFTIKSELTDIKQEFAVAKEITLSLNWLTNKIGQEIPKERVLVILERLGFKLTENGESSLSVIIPSWRATKDVSTKEDLAEEVLRIYGYDNIAAQLPMETLRLPEVNLERVIERKIKNILVLKYNLSEVYNYSFVGEDQLKKLEIDFSNHLKLANPLSDVQTILRQSLVPGLVANIKSNQFKADSLGFFELGSVFYNTPGLFKKEASGDSTLPYQEKRLGLVLAGNDKNVFDKLKGVVSNFIKNIIHYDIEVDFLLAEEIPGWADKKNVAGITVLGRRIGIVSLLNQSARDNINLKKFIALGEINLRELVELILTTGGTHYQEPAKYPSVIRDLAFVVNEKILYNELKNEMTKFNPLIKEVELFDIYSGNKLVGDEKSLAFHLTFQSEDRTLLTNEVDEVVASLIKYLGDKFEARLRD